MVHSVDVEPRGMYYKALAPLMPSATQRILASIHPRLKALLEGETTPPSRKLESVPSGAMMGGIVVAAVGGIVLLLLGRRRSGRR